MSERVTLYAVVGHCGTYSDYKDWVVVLYPYREQAEEHCRRANERFQEECKRYDDALFGDTYHKCHNPYDTVETDYGSPMMSYYSTEDAGYEVEEYPLHPGLDDYLDHHRVSE